MKFLKEPLGFPYMHYKWLIKTKHFLFGFLKEGQRYGKPYNYGFSKFPNRLSIIYVLYCDRLVFEYEYFRKERRWMQNYHEVKSTATENLSQIKRKK